MNTVARVGTFANTFFTNLNYDWYQKEIDVPNALTQDQSIVLAIAVMDAEVGYYERALNFLSACQLNVSMSNIALHPKWRNDVVHFLAE